MRHNITPNPDPAQPIRRQLRAAVNATEALGETLAVTLTRRTSQAGLAKLQRAVDRAEVSMCACHAPLEQQQCYRQPVNSSGSGQAAARQGPCRDVSLRSSLLFGCFGPEAAASLVA
jgi:hypothetical protein